MTSDHLDDPLDYLYEELPPERMAEAKRHLSDCPRCREDMRDVRETVKAYRQADPPSPPEGLARRTAALALELTRRDTAVVAAAKPVPARSELAAEPVETTEPAETPTALVPVRDDEFDRMKQEVMGELKSSRRSILFHPGWAVAASVIFVCFLLIEYSPRNASMRQPAREHSVTTESDRFSDMAEPTPLPAPRTVEEKSNAPFSAAPPLLRQEKTLGRMDALPPSPATTAPSILQPESVPVPKPPESMPDSGSSLRPPPAPIPASSPSPATGAAQEQFDAGKNEPSAQTTLPSFGAAPEASVMRAKRIAPPPPLAESAVQSHDTTLGEADMSAPSMPPAPAAPLSPNVTRPQGGASATRESEPALIEEFDFREPPQLIARPTPIDTEKLIRDLSTLAGMQIGSGEIADAWITVGLLRRYDSEKANELAAILEAMERTNNEAAVAARAKAASEAATESGIATSTGDFQSDKYAPLGAGGTAPMTDVDTSPPASAASTPALEPHPSSAPAAAAVAPIAPAPPEPQELPAGVEILHLPDPPVEVLGESPVSISEPPASSSPVFELVLPPESGVVDAPTVPKSSETALPPTLWDSTQGRSRAFDGGRQGHNRRIRPFTTDPYVRDDESGRNR